VVRAGCGDFERPPRLGLADDLVEIAVQLLLGDDGATRAAQVSMAS